MYDNRNWLWQYQNSDTISTLYNGLFSIVSSASPLPMLSLFDVDNISGYELGFLSKLLNIKEIGGIITDAVIWSVTNWNDPTKFWNGVSSGRDDMFYRNYIKMKTNMFSKPICIATIKESFDILLGEDYECEIDEDSYSFDINITVSDTYIYNILLAMLNIDPTPFGKPAGYSYTINITQG